MPECCQPLQLTKESLDHFTAHLANGPTDPLVVELQSHLATHWSYQKLFLKYVVGSVAVFGKVNECSLKIIFGFCNRRETSCLSYLLDKLEQKNDVDTVAYFMTGPIGHEPPLTNRIRQLVAKLIRKNWKVTEGLAMRSLEAFKNTGQHYEYYRLLVTHLPVELQYEMIRTREIAQGEIGNLYNGEVDRELREIFLLARCSHNPDPEIRKHIADVFPFFKQCLAEDRVGSRIESPCPGRIPELTDDALSHIARLMDVETVVCVMPMVCRTWRNLHSRIVLDNRKVVDLYLLDLKYIELDKIYTTMPWKRHLGDETNVLKYFGQCIEDGALDRIEPTFRLRENMRKYLKAVIRGRTVLPRIEDCGTQYDRFVELFERVYGFCGDETKPNLGKPEFLTDEEYDRAVYHFVYEKRRVLRLSSLLAVDDMPRLFGIIQEDEELMKRLVDRNFRGPMEPALALIVSWQTRQIPDKLARLVLGQMKWFRKLAEQRAVSLRECYSYMVESGILPKAVKHYYDEGVMIARLLVSLVMMFKDEAEMLDRMEALMAGAYIGRDGAIQEDIKRSFEKISFERLMAAEGYSKEDMAFFRGVMTRCGLL